MNAAGGRAAAELCSAWTGRSPVTTPTRLYASLRLDGGQGGQAEGRVWASLVVAHVGIVVVVDVDVGNLLEVALTGVAGAGADDVHGAGGARLRRIIVRVLIAGGDVDLATVGGGGGGKRVGVSETRSKELDGTGASAAYVEQKHSRHVTGDNDHLSAVGNELRVDRREIALAQVEELRFLGEIHRRSVTGELSIWQSRLRVGSGENVNVRRIECEHVLSVRRREDLKRNAGCDYEVKVWRIGMSGLRIARGDTGN